MDALDNVGALVIVLICLTPFAPFLMAGILVWAWKHRNDVPDPTPIPGRGPVQ